jgi:hypothetical protein
LLILVDLFPIIVWCERLLFVLLILVDLFPIIVWCEVVVVCFVNIGGFVSHHLLMWGGCCLFC